MASTAQSWVQSTLREQVLPSSLGPTLPHVGPPLLAPSHTYPTNPQVPIFFPLDLQDWRWFMLNPVNLFSNATHMLSLVTSQTTLYAKTDEFLRATLRLDANLTAYIVKDWQWSDFHSLFLEQSILLFNDWPWNYSSRTLREFVSVALVQISDSMQSSSNHSHKYYNFDA